MLLVVYPCCLCKLIVCFFPPMILTREVIDRIGPAFHIHATRELPLVGRQEGLAKGFFSTRRNDHLHSILS